VPATSRNVIADLHRARMILTSIADDDLRAARDNALEPPPFFEEF